MTQTRLPKHTPILVGIGTANQHLDDPLQADEAVDLMTRAARAAIDDCQVQATQIASVIGEVSAPEGLAPYKNPARTVADACGASNARSVFAKVGILQQTLITRACEAISEGALKAALVVGGEAKHRALRADIAGLTLKNKACDEPPDETLQPSQEIVHPLEVACGLVMPVEFYAVIENALRAALSIDQDQARDEIAKMWATFSQVASKNPEAWERESWSAERIRMHGDNNRMLAWPYTKAHNSQWNVDQAAALLFCSIDTAEQLGIDPKYWVWPQGFAENNHMVQLMQRPHLHRSPGARLAAQRALELAETELSAIDFIDLYSCFPSAVRVQALELGLKRAGEQILSFTGGMRFAGGPLNNYVLQSTARAGRLLREARASGNSQAKALLSCISGIINKQGFAIWGAAPNAGGFQCADVSVETERTEAAPITAVAEITGPATIAGYTVLFDKKEQLPKAVLAICDLPEEDGKKRRTAARCDDAESANMLIRNEGCGQRVSLDGAGAFSLSPP